MSHHNKTSNLFQTFDPNAEVAVNERNLPHWFQAGAAMFVTFRTADSIPKEVIIRWQRELEEWLSERNAPIELAESVVHRRLKNHAHLLDRIAGSEQREFRKLSERIFHRSLDTCQGAFLLKQPELAKIVAEAVLYYDGDKYDIDRFVVMPNHVHAIVQFRSGASLKTVSQSWMRYTARKIKSAIGEPGVFWQPEAFDHIIRSPEQFEYLQQYVFENPKKANLCEGEFLYWQRL